MVYASFFLLLTLILSVLSAFLGGWWWLLMWPTINAFAMMLAYLGVGSRMCGKRADGTMSPLPVLLLLPYLLLTWIIWHLSRRISSEACWNQIAPGLYLGRRAYARELPEDASLVVDLTAEFPEPADVRRGRTYRGLPTLDGGVSSDTALVALVKEIAAWKGAVYVHCAAGHGRSAAVMAVTLVASGLAADVEGAMSLIQLARPLARLHAAQRVTANRAARLLLVDVENFPGTWAS